jgi:hypothetical protein
VNRFERKISGTIRILLIVLVVFTIAYDTKNYTTIKEFLIILERSNTNNMTDKGLEELFE